MISQTDAKLIRKVRVKWLKKQSVEQKPMAKTNRALNIAGLNGETISTKQ